MFTVKKSVEINAPVEKVFKYVAAVENMPEVWPSLEEIHDIRPLANGCHTYDWTYKMAGVRLKGHTEDEAVEDCKRIVSRVAGGIEGRMTWTFEEISPNATRVTTQTDYAVPIPVIGKLAEGVVHRMNEHEGEVLLANLKSRMEE